MTPSELFERCNNTELYQIACAAGLSVQPSTPKNLLIQYIVGEEIPPPEAHEFDAWRLAIMGFVIEHRKRLEVQLRCPAKSMDPRACFQCVDHQVSSCLIENKTNLHLILLHKKPFEPPTPVGETMTTTALNPQNAPRDKEKLKGAGSFQLRKLADALGMLPAEPEQLAFGKLSPDERVEEIMKRLLDLDSKGGAPTNGTSAPAASAPAATADQPGTSMPAVDPAAFRSAQDATSAGPGVATPGRRQPREATNGTTAPSGEGAAILAAIQALTGSTQAQVALLQELKGISAAFDLKVQALTTVAAEQTTLLKLAMAAVLTIAEERGVASRFEILQDAVGEAGNLDAMLAEIRGAANKSGKAA